MTAPSPPLRRRRPRRALQAGLIAAGFALIPRHRWVAWAVLPGMGLNLAAIFRLWPDAEECWKLHPMWRMDDDD